MTFLQIVTSEMARGNCITSVDWTDGTLTIINKTYEAGEVV